jgi:hemin uptake protein HemP
MQRDAAASGRRAAMPGAAEAQPGLPTLRRIDSQALLGAAQEVEIVHAGQLYRLRRTALGKLILTK